VVKINTSLRALLISLISKRDIGQKHTPEKALIKHKKKWVSKQEKKEFFKEYTDMAREGFLIRTKKRTGKSSDWHVSINPKKVNELKDLLFTKA
jgi:hypothetical protein